MRKQQTEMILELEVIISGGYEIVGITEKWLRDEDEDEWRGINILGMTYSVRDVGVWLLM